MGDLEETVGKLRAILEGTGAPVVGVAGNGASNTIFVYLSFPWPEVPKKIGPYKVYTALLTVGS